MEIFKINQLLDPCVEGALKPYGISKNETPRFAPLPQIGQRTDGFHERVDDLQVSVRSLLSKKKGYS